MKAEVIYAALADSDIREAWLYVAERNTVAADALMDELKRAETMLRDTPLAGALRSDLGSAIRAWPTRSGYIIYYSYEGGALKIHRILHHARETRRFFL